MSTRQIRVAILVVLAALSSAAASMAEGRFHNGSLRGSYAYTGEGHGDHSESLSVGTIDFDGQGNLTRALTLNAPGTNGNRSILKIESAGTYRVRADGTGRLDFVNEFSDGSANVVTMDFVIEASRLRESATTNEVLDLFAVQRQPGLTVNLVTARIRRSTP